LIGGAWFGSLLDFALFARKTGFGFLICWLLKPLARAMSSSRRRLSQADEKGRRLTERPRTLKLGSIQNQNASDFPPSMACPVGETSGTAWPPLEFVRSLWDGHSITRMPPAPMSKYGFESYKRCNHTLKDILKLRTAKVADC
jgi:hypothetical protein